LSEKVEQLKINKMNNKENLLTKAIAESAVQPDLKNKNYTIPRTFGVYEIESSANTKKFRYGNHPVREKELLNEFGKVKRHALFLDRNDAKELADYLNS
jgi:hypothetical protein